ncbi:MAG: TetR/AcrR family transcriptional regulator [Bacteroidota bacterium]
MPKSTFNNLSESKRKHFINESYKEFGLHSYESASITNLVKKLGIAKGSVYQYFDDKRDLYQFLITEANLQLDTLVTKACPYQNEPFFDWYLKLIMVEVKFYLSFPQYAIMFQQLMTATDNDLKEVCAELYNNWKNKIEDNTPYKIGSSAVSINQLVNAPLYIFNLITKDLDLESLINNGEPVFMETKDLVNLCTVWVRKLEHGQ